MPVTFENANYQSFVNFAQGRFDAGGKTAVISTSVANSLQDRSILFIDESKTDSVHKWRRNAGEVTDNNQTRTLFQQTIADMFGGESKIPKSVKKAMRNKISKAVKSFPDGFPFEYEESGAARFELSISLKSTLN